MPMIDSKITTPVSQEKRDILKAELGKAISIMGKSESYLMLGFEDNYDLYFAGKKVEEGAFVTVQLFGALSSGACDKMTAKICDIYQKQLGLSPDKIYITYQGIDNWGWNGSNF